MRARLAALERRGDVEDHDLVDALDVVAPRQRRRIAGVAQALEVHALDDLAVAHVEAGDDALREHLPRSQLREDAQAGVAGFLGMELHADTLPRSTAALNGTPYSQIAAVSSTTGAA